MFTSNNTVDKFNIKYRLPVNQRKHMGAVHIRPQHIFFSRQDQGETILVITRKDMISNLGWVIKSILYLLLPLLFWGIIDLTFGISGMISYNPFDILKFLPEYITPGLIAGFGLCYYALIFSYMYSKVVSWFLNVYVITNERIIHTVFHTLSGISVSETPLKNIIDISSKSYGLFPAIFDYGDVVVQTAAERSRFIFKEIPDPGWFKGVLMDIIKIAKGGEP